MNVKKAIVHALKPYGFVDRIILFGSRARGDNEPKSDYDIAIDCPAARWEDWVTLVQSIEALPTLLNIQLVCYNTASQELRARIQEEGVVLYEQKGKPVTVKSRKSPSALRRSHPNIRT